MRVFWNILARLQSKPIAGDETYVPSDAAEESGGECLGPELTQSIFTQGDGTSDSPYLISNGAEFRAIAEHPSAHFRLTKDILLWGAITPIEQFEGVIHGCGFKVEEFFSSSYWIRINHGYIQGIEFVEPKIRAADDALDVALILENRGKILECRTECASFYSPSVSRDALLAGWAAVNTGLIARTVFSGELHSNGASIGGMVGLNLQQGILSECEAIAVGPTTREYETQKGTAMGGLAVENRGLIVSCHTWGRLRLRCFAQGEVGGLLARQVEGGVIESSDSVCSIEVVSSRLKLVGGLVAVNHGVIRDGAYSGRLSVLSTLAQVGLLVADQGETGELELGPKFEQFIKLAEQGKFEVSHANVQLIGSPPLLDQAQSALELSAGTSH